MSDSSSTENVQQSPIEPDDASRAADVPSSDGPHFSRRSVLKATGAALVGGAASLVGVPSLAAPSIHIPSRAASLRARPNIVLILTDQERYPRHWPAGWTDTNLPNRKRLVDYGLNFTQAFCNSCMCSPSRSTLFTGVYPAQHGVVSTLTSGGPASAAEPQLPLDIQNMAHMLTSAGYNVHYRGKWHLSKGSDGGKPQVADVTAYGFKGWQEPDAGENTSLDSFGGGEANHDQAYIQQAVDFLTTQTATDSAEHPFALIVSLVNPHDVLAYPGTVDDDAVYAADTTKYNQGLSWTDVPSRLENLVTNNKPTAQAQMLVLLAAALGPLALPPSADRDNYVNFYGYLQILTDRHIGSLLDTLDTQGLTESTVVIRTSDHGELGLAHGGLRQKAFNAYHEAINIPLTIANPLLFPAPQTTNALASLVDIMPTVATLAGIPNRDAWVFKGVDLSTLFENPSASVQDAVLFTYDDQNAGSSNYQTIVKQPNHIRALFDGRWKYVRYFDPSGVEANQYEVYDHQSDPNEMNNLAGQDMPEETELANKLATLEAERLGTELLHKRYVPIVSR